MKSLQLTSAVLLIGILSVAVTASRQTGYLKELKARTRNFTEFIERPQRISQRSELGIAQIKHLKQGYICTGVHLRPWILLTTASCVKGQDVKQLFVEVVYSQVYKYLKDVRVEDVYIHPKYDAKLRRNNFAMMSIHGKFYWDVKPFSLPEKDYTAPQIVRGGFGTKVMRWRWYERVQAYLPFSCKSVVTVDGICGDLKAVDKNMCVKKGECEEVFTTNDIGSPLYFRDPSSWYLQRKSRILVGLYTGSELDNIDNKLFERVYPVLNFIEDFIFDHRLPPSP